MVVLKMTDWARLSIKKETLFVLVFLRLALWSPHYIASYMGRGSWSLCWLLLVCPLFVVPRFTTLPGTLPFGLGHIIVIVQLWQVLHSRGTDDRG